ncbi:hypothetical protein Fmac_029127 [Flemingia macrophylla]|uniref:Uncharacterized protein n=1 Tax=Flemingia macrophylla TaxID=520843 RepID=A0ABD1L9G2_9FABA
MMYYRKIKSNKSFQEYQEKFIKNDIYTKIRNPYNISTSSQPENYATNMPNILPSVQNVNGIKQNWPNLNGDDKSFWEHEWLKHGICCENNFKQFDYFNLAVTIKGRIDLMVILASANITPNLTKRYTANSISNAIFAVTKSIPELYCNDNHGDLKLQEIRICLVANGTSYTNCSSLSSSCSKGHGQIYWPIS